MIRHEFNKNMNSLDGGVGRSIKKVSRRPAESPDLDSNDPVVDVNDMNVDSEREDEFELLDGDVTKEIVDGISSITFSDREVGEEQLLSREAEIQQRVEEEKFGSWMLVECKNKSKTRPVTNPGNATNGAVSDGSRFGVLNDNHGEEIGVNFCGQEGKNRD
ncbi:hypothetical protein Gogos_015251, partial [Gossypium gossypioides]|nr:hypothetical protein [Gossypium gossypioides]